MKQKPTFYLSFQNTFIKIIYDISFEYNFSSMSFKRDFFGTVWQSIVNCLCIRVLWTNK